VQRSSPTPTTSVTRRWTSRPDPVGRSGGKRVRPEGHGQCAKASPPSTMRSPPSRRAPGSTRSSPDRVGRVRNLQPEDLAGVTRSTTSSTRNCLEPGAWRAAGWTYRGFGRQ
jgi:hypothetical protein